MKRDDLQALLVEHTEAWNSHDLDRSIGLLADDCAFEASAGPGPRGRTFKGRMQVRAAFAEVLDSMPDAKWGGGRVIGCDFLSIRGYEIVRAARPSEGSMIPCWS